MEIVDGQIQIQPLLTVTLGGLVLFFGRSLNRRFPFLQQFTIPEPVGGGWVIRSHDFLATVPSMSASSSERFRRWPC
jgi:sodium--glutamate symport carrier gltS